MCVCFLTNSIKITKIRSNLCLRVRESESKRVRERERMCEPRYQCDQMVKLCFNIWPYATMKISQNKATNLPK